MIREQGPPGRAGTPGGVPVFQIGSTVSGPVPLVTITEVNPLLYTLDFVIPQIGTGLPNSWTAVQTFDLPPVFVTGFTATGASTAVDLTISGTFTMNGPGFFVGDSVFNGDTTFNGLNHFVGDTDAVNLTVSGIFKIPNITQLGAGVAQLGTVVIVPDGTLYYAVPSGTNIVIGSMALATVVVFNAAEASFFSSAFVIPAGPSAQVTLYAQLTIVFSGANPPVDVGQFYLRARLDDAVIGTVVSASAGTNFEATIQLSSSVLVPAGAHTMYFTMQGLAVGTSSIVMTGITTRISF